MRVFAVALLALVWAIGLGEIASAKILPMTDAMAVSDVVHQNLAHSDDLDINLIGEGTYAVAYWNAAGGYAAGAALLQKTAGNWHLIKLSKKPFTTAADLQILGVPASQAQALIADIHKASGAQ